MTTSAPIPATEVASPMVNPSDTAPEAATDQAQARAGATAVVRPSLRAQVAENPLLSFFGLLIVALLAAAIASPHIRIDDINLRIGRLEAKVDRLEAKVDRLEVRVDRLEARFIEFERRVDARFDMVDARFDKLEAAVAEIDRKLTALIAHLNATTAVDDALAGRLTGPSGPDASGTGDDEPG